MSRFARSFRALTWLALSSAVACSHEPPTAATAGHPSGAAIAGSSSRGRFVPGRVLVEFRVGADEGAVASVNQVTLGRRVMNRLRLVSVTPGHERAMANKLAKDPRVAFAEPDWIRTLDDPQCTGCALPGDQLFGYKWDLDNDGEVNSETGDPLAATGRVDADVDWLEAFDQLGPGFAGAARIGILDTGVRATHEDLSGKVVDQYDFVNDDADASDDQGHGTHVAGIAAARGGNARGLAGIGYGENVRLLVAKVCRPTFFGLNAECTSSDLAAGITWAVDHGANVLNISLGGTESSETERLALQYARDHGVLPFCAAGNSAQGAVLYPAAFAECVAVSATDWGDDLASYSNYGPEVQLSAPGGDTENSSGYSQIASTCFDSDTAYCLKAGTSMATPQAAGLAALLFATGVGTADQVLQRMETTADDLGDPGWDPRFGFGRIDVYNAINDTPGAPPDLPPTAAFTSACTDLSCAFTDASTDTDGSVVAWSWSFGDGQTSTERNPTHAFACSGTYTVQLRVTDDRGAPGFAAHAVTVTAPVSIEPGSPAEIPGLVMWLRADQMDGLSNGDPVAVWPDGSGSCHSATQADPLKRPVWRESQVAGRPAVVFDATDDGLATSVDPGTATTIVATYSSRAGATGHLLNGGFSFFMGPYVGRYRNYTGQYMTGPAIEPGRWIVQGFRQAPGRAELFVDGAFAATTTRTVDPYALGIARQGTYSKILDGGIAEIAVYDRTLDDAELDRVEQWMLDRYLPPAPPNNPPTAEFSSACTDLSCAFTDASTDPDGSVAGWSWDFGDGATSNQQSPLHAYDSAGTYTVTLVATDDDGDTGSIHHDVTVTEPAGGGGGPFVDPSSVPGLDLWLRADLLTGLADGDPVAVWPDASGHGHDATQGTAAKRPRYETNRVNGLPAVFFDAVDDGLATPVDPPRDVTIFVVYASRAGATGAVLNGGFAFFLGPYVNYYRNYTYGYATGPHVTAGRWLVHTLRQSSSLDELFVDGAFQASTTRTADPYTLGIARQGTYGKILDGWIAEIVVYGRALTDEERGDVEEWLKARYGLP